MGKRIQENHITITRTARYFTLGNIHGPLRQVWFVCHGYGQLAGYFIRHFDVLNDEHRLIIAPEGLSRFYLDTNSGRVGASWMTREDRLKEIDDYLYYLESLYTQVFKSVQRTAVTVYILGFSQGVATVCRWISHGMVKADRLILWAGFVPPDLDLAENKKFFQKLELSMVVGKQDDYINLLLLSQQEARLKKQEISYQLITFDGGHQLNAEVLRKLAES